MSHVCHHRNGLEGPPPQPPLSSEKWPGGDPAQPMFLEIPNSSRKLINKIVIFSPPKSHAY
jgi:hypothetical protein